jgi:hypothetical protein
MIAGNNSFDLPFGDFFWVFFAGFSPLVSSSTNAFNPASRSASSILRRVFNHALLPSSSSV